MARAPADYRVVVRPAPRARGREPRPDTLAFLDTLRTGQAVRVPLRGVPYRRITARYAQAAYRAGCRCRVRRDGNAVVAWCEKKENG